MRLLRPLLAAIVLTAVAAPMARADAVASRVSTISTWGGGSAPGPSMQLLGQGGELASGGTFTVFLQVNEAPPGSELAVDLYQPIDDRESLDASVDGEPDGSAATFAVVPLAQGTRASQQSGFAISDGPAGPWSSPMPEPGVYPVRVRLRGPDREVLTSMVLYLVRSDGSSGQPTTVAILAEVHRPPGPERIPDIGVFDFSAGTDPRQEVGPEPITVDPTWQGQVADVIDLLARHRTIPVSFSITPETADILAADVQDPTMVGLRREVTRPGRELLGGTYVDVDVAALTSEDLGDVVLRQTDLGQRTLQRIFGNPGSATWHLGDAVDRPAAELLRVVGVNHLLLPDGALDTDASTRPVALGSGLDLLATTESPITFDANPTDPVLAGHQLLGRLAALAYIDPAPAGAVLRADPATIDARQLAVVLDGLESSQSLRPSTVSNLITEVPAEPIPFEPPDRDIPDQGLYPARTHRTQELLTNFASMLPVPTVATMAFEVPLAQAASRDLTLEDRLDRLGRLEDTLETLMSGIELPERDRITLGARNASFPLRITSRLETPVDVLVSFEASDRLEVPQAPQTRRLEPGSTLLAIPVQVRASGDTQLNIRVTTPDGRYLLAESRYTIRSTAVSGVGLLLTLGAGTFLALWWGRHFLRSRRDHRPRHARNRVRTSNPEDTGSSADDVFVNDV